MIRSDKIRKQKPVEIIESHWWQCLTRVQRVQDFFFISRELAWEIGVLFLIQRGNSFPQGNFWEIVAQLLDTKSQKNRWYFQQNCGYLRVLLKFQGCQPWVVVYEDLKICFFWFNSNAAINLKHQVTATKLSSVNQRLAYQSSIITSTKIPHHFTRP